MILNHFKRLLLIGLFTTLSTGLSHANDTIKQSTITVTGSHSIIIPHDTAIIRGSVITTNTKAKHAVQENAQIIEKIKSNLKRNNINPKDLVTNQYNLTINYDYPNGQQVFKNYQVTHDISIETKNINRIGTLADLLTEAGVNHISQVEFISSNSKQAFDDALKNAVLDAHTKAKLAISGINNTSIGKILVVNVNPENHTPQPVMYATMDRSMVAAAKAPTEFQTKGQTISINVNTVWEVINP